MLYIVTCYLWKMTFVCYLCHAFPPRWSGFLGNLQHPFPSTVQKTEGLLCVCVCVCVSVRVIVWWQDYGPGQTFQISSYSTGMRASFSPNIHTDSGAHSRLLLSGYWEPPSSAAVKNKELKHIPPPPRAFMGWATTALPNICYPTILCSLPSALTSMYSNSTYQENVHVLQWSIWKQSESSSPV